MPRGGRRDGAGAPRGHRKATIAKIEAANICEQAASAQLAADKHANAGKKLAKDVLEEFMLLFAGMAATHQLLPPGMPVPPGRSPDEAKFEKWSRLAVETAAKLADFQSPRFKTVAVMAPPLAAPRENKDAEVIQLDDPVALARVYQRRITAVR